MKLLFAIKSLTSSAGGAERVFCTICSELADRGHNVLIITFDQPGRQPFYPFDERVKRIDLGIGDSSSQARFGVTIRRMKALRQIVLAERPDATVGFMHSMFVPLAFALVGTSIAVLGSEHIVPEHYRTRPMQYGLMMVASIFLSRITVLSEAIRVHYPSLVRSRMVIMPNPVTQVTKGVSVNGGKHEHILLSIGRLDDQKDHATLLRAFAFIAADFPDWHLKILGEGPLRRELEELVEVLDLRTRVTMLGVTSAIGAEYRSVEAFVLPSRYESFGLVTAEAMSYGLPVVGFADCPGTNELIHNGETGILVSPGNDRVLSLAHALAGLLADPVLRLHLGKAARQAIDDRFSPQQVCDLWEHLLRSVSSSRSSRSSSCDETH